MFREFSFWMVIFVVVLSLYGTAIATTTAELSDKTVIRQVLVENVLPVHKVPYKYGERLNVKNSTKDYDLCPTCGLRSVGSCKCPLAESLCSAGHKWHLDGNSIVTSGWTKIDTHKRSSKFVDFGW